MTRSILLFAYEILAQKEVVSWSNFKVSDYIEGSEEDGKVEGKSRELKTIFDITNQPIGSAEFKIEVASACAESGINYIEFAKMYNLNANELNVWALDFLGEGLK